MEVSDAEIEFSREFSVVHGDDGPDRVTGRIVAAIVFLFFYVLLAVASKAADQVLADRRAETAKKEEAS